MTAKCHKVEKMMAVANEMPGRYVPWHYPITGPGTTRLLTKAPALSEVAGLAGLDWTIVKEPVFSGNVLRRAHGPEGMSVARRYHLEGSDMYNEIGAGGQYEVKENADAGREGVSRIDGSDSLSIVGSKWEPLQNHDMIWRLGQLVDDPWVNVDTAGSLRHGKDVFVSVRVDDLERVHVDGSLSQCYLVAGTENTANGSSWYGYFYVRVVCKNTLTWGKNSAPLTVRIPHTSAMPSIADMQQTLRLSLNHTTESFDTIEELSKIRVSWVDGLDIIKKLIPFPVAPDGGWATQRSIDQRDRKIAKIFDFWEDGDVTVPRKLTNTGWGLWQSLTGWQWETGQSSATRQFTRILNGTETDWQNQV